MTGLAPANCTITYTYQCDICFREEKQKVNVGRGQEIPILFPSGWRAVNSAIVCPDHHLIVKSTSRLSGQPDGEFVP